MKNDAQGSPANAGPPSPAFLPPFRARRGLFYALLTALAVWIAVLLILYFTTVHSAK